MIWMLGQHSLILYTDGTGGVTYIPEGCAVVQSDLTRLENWANGNFIKFNPALGKTQPQASVCGG